MSENLRAVGYGSGSSNLMRHLFLGLGAVYAIFPLIWILSTSLKKGEDVFSSNIELIPSKIAWENYWNVISENDFMFLRWFGNSVLVAFGTTIIGIFLASTAAYAFSRFRFPGRKAGLFVFLLTQMFPGIILVVPLYQIMRSIGLLNTYWGLMIAYSTSSLPFCVFMLKGYFDVIPASLENAARIDGLSTWGIFYKIMVPLSLPGIAVTGFFSLITAWNEFMLALTFMNQEELFLLPVGLKKYVFDYKTQWHMVSAAAMIITLPVLFIWLKVQSALMSGKLAGAVKA